MHLVIRWQLFGVSCWCLVFCCFFFWFFSYIRTFFFSFSPAPGFLSPVLVSPSTLIQARFLGQKADRPRNSRVDADESGIIQGLQILVALPTNANRYRGHSELLGAHGRLRMLRLTPSQRCPHAHAGLLRGFLIDNPNARLYALFFKNDGSCSTAGAGACVFVLRKNRTTREAERQNETGTRRWRVTPAVQQRQ